MPRQPYRSSPSITFGPELSDAAKALIIANVAVFVVQFAAPGITRTFGLWPAQVVSGLAVWRLVTYMFLHVGPFHLLFNMLALWMFGSELERRWGTRTFVRFYFVTGVGAAVLTVLTAYLVFPALRNANVVGASGAIYGLLLGFALTYPDRPIYMYLVFPIPAKYFVMIMGALAFYSSIAEPGGVAHATHLGGLLVGYVFLRGIRLHPWAEVKYRYLKWKMGRARKRFDVVRGGRADDWNKRIH